jgi:endonuclease/exonuclease/phosphatase family metal-dependent hydrolase
MKISIITLNIANSITEEKENPIKDRLDSLCKYIKENIDTYKVQIVCLQEIRHTEALSIQEFVTKLISYIGHWDYELQRVNRQKNSFYRMTLWDNTIWFCEQKLNHYVKNTLIQQVFFRDVRRGNKYINVLNTHAPSSDIDLRLLYWSKAFSVMNEKTILVGDMNKQGETVKEYTKELEKQNVKDFIEFVKDKYITYKSWSNSDTDYTSHLDSVAIHNKTDCKETKIFISDNTKIEPRPSDHFAIIFQGTI